MIPADPIPCSPSGASLPFSTKHCSWRFSALLVKWKPCIKPT